MTYRLGTILKAVSTNQVARIAPAAYVRLTAQTGRGAQDGETAAEIAGYFRRCVSEYGDVLMMSQDRLSECLREKVILEYGPGDMPGVALLLIAYGARKVYCADRFPLVRIDKKRVEVVKQLASLLDEFQRERLYSCFINPASIEEGFNLDRIDYLVRPSGLSGLRNEVDLVLSRAVLEHVNDLEATFRDMLTAMRPGAQAVHQVDLRSHGLHTNNPLDFLSVPTWLWHAMHSNKGVPNRWRVDRYQAIMKNLAIEATTLRATSLYSPEDVSTVRRSLAAPFSLISDDLLAWQGFWLVFSNKAGCAGA